MHEHMDQFNLINMNGRAYDPIMGQFLSADPFVQNPSSTVNYNRYSYCMNNPLNRIDPSGYIWGDAYDLSDDNFRLPKLLLDMDGIGAGGRTTDEIVNDLWNRVPANGGGYFPFANGEPDLMNSYIWDDEGNVYDGYNVLLDGYSVMHITRGGNRIQRKNKNYDSGIWKHYSHSVFYKGLTAVAHTSWFSGYHIIKEGNDPFGFFSNGSAAGQGGPGWEAYAGAAASIASEMYYSKTFGTWMGKNFKMYKQVWGGNGVTGGKNKFGKTTSNAIKWLIRVGPN